MVRTQIQLTEEQMERLRKASDREQVSIAELIRRSIDRTLSEAPTARKADRKRRAMEAMDRYASGANDVSVEHDKYLEDAFR